MATIVMGIWGGRNLTPTPQVTGDLQSISQDIGSPETGPAAHPTPNKQVGTTGQRDWEGKATGQNNSIKVGSNIIQRIRPIFGMTKSIDPTNPDIQINRQDSTQSQSAGTGRNDPSPVEGIHPALVTTYNPAVSTTQLPAKRNTGTMSPIRR